MTPDPVELARQVLDAGGRRDLDAAMGMFAPDVVWESLDGLGVFDGATAVRGFLEEWISSYELYEIAPEEVLDVGSGVAFVVGRESGRLLGAADRVKQRTAWAMAWEHGLVVHIIAGLDVDKTRAAAERLAQDRADV